jgi:type IV pilus assembly protein PilF
VNAIKGRLKHIDNCRHYISFLLIFIVTVLLSACSFSQPQTQAEKIQEIELNQSSEPDFKEAAKINAELGILYTQRNLLDLAKIKILAAEKLYDLPIVHTAFGVYYARMNENKLAEKEFQKSLSMAPNDSRTLTFYASFLCAKKRYMQSEKLYNKAINEVANTQLGVTYLSYASCQFSEGKSEEAKQSFKNAIEQNPTLSSAYLSLAKIYVDEKKYNKADNMLNNYLNLEVQNRTSLEIEVQIAQGLHEENREATAKLILNSLY